MKSTTTIFPILLIHLLVSLSFLTAQDLKGGKVTYEQIIDYQLEGAFDDPRWDAYIADLPKTGKSFHTLSFTMKQALYEEDLTQKQDLSQSLRGALMKANYSKSPKPEVKKIFYDFGKKERLEQTEFMTRFFLVESPLEQKAWKITTRKKKVLDYVCLGADLQVGEETVTAWFTAEIPVSAGPENYYGLPGLILGVEKNDEVFILATSVDLTPPEESALHSLEKGQKVSAEKFDKILEQKLEEYQKTMEAKRKAKTKG